MKINSLLNQFSVIESLFPIEIQMDSHLFFFYEVFLKKIDTSKTPAENLFQFLIDNPSLQTQKVSSFTYSLIKNPKEFNEKDLASLCETFFRKGKAVPILGSDILSISNNLIKINRNDGFFDEFPNLSVYTFLQEFKSLCLVGFFTESFSQYRNAYMNNNLSLIKKIEESISKDLENQYKESILKESLGLRDEGSEDLNFQILTIIHPTNYDFKENIEKTNKNLIESLDLRTFIESFSKIYLEYRNCHEN